MDGLSISFGGQSAKVAKRCDGQTCTKNQPISGDDSTKNQPLAATARDRARAGAGLFVAGAVEIMKGEQRGSARVAVGLFLAGAVASLGAYKLLEARQKRRQAAKVLALKAWAEAWVESGCVPGLNVLITHEGQEVCHVMAGHADAAKRTPTARDTIYRIYSMTKPVTAALAFILMEKGKLSLDDDVAKYIPAFARDKLRVFVGGDAVNPVTEPLKGPLLVRHLLSHTSGLTYGIFGAHPCDKLLSASFTPAEQADWLASVPMPKLLTAIAATPLLFQPGSAWHYGFSSDVLGALLEVAGGKDLGQLMASEIFAPLGLSADTAFQVPAAAAPRLAQCCSSTPGFGFAPTSEATCGSDKLRKPPALHGGGGLVSNVDDYAKLVAFLVTGKCPRFPNQKGAVVALLSPASLSLMRANALPGGQDLSDASFLKGTAFSEASGKGAGYGLGSVSVVTDPTRCPGGRLSGAGEFGWGGVASTWFFADPLKDVSVILMTQLVPSSAFPVRPQLRYLAHWAVAAGDSGEDL